MGFEVKYLPMHSDAASPSRVRTRRKPSLLEAADGETPDRKDEVQLSALEPNPPPRTTRFAPPSVSRHISRTLPCMS